MDKAALLLRRVTVTSLPYKGLATQRWHGAESSRWIAGRRAFLAGVWGSRTPQWSRAERGGQSVGGRAPSDLGDT